MVTSPSLWTVQMVRDLPPDGNRYELVDGVLLVTPSARPTHQLIVSRLARRLVPYVDRVAPQLGVHLSESEITWGEEHTYLQPDIYVAPDVEFVDRWTDVRSLCLTVEVLSPSSVKHDRVTKRPVYQRHGVGTYWIVDIAAGSVEVWHPGDVRPEIVTDTLRWQIAPKAPILDIPLAELFATPTKT